MKLLNVFVLLIASLFRLIFAQPYLEQVPQEDLETIEKLFSYLFLDERFSYVVFGSKPMANTAYDKNTPAEYQVLYHHPMFELESWWNTWEKYCHLVPMKDFLLFAKNGEDCFQIFLIHQPHALKVIEENLSLFRHKIEMKGSANELLDHIVSSNNVFQEGLNKSRALLGLLLGFGKKNALGFERYYSKNRKFHFLSRSPRASFEVAGVELIETEKLFIPPFISFSTKETVRIVKQYTQDRVRILEEYSQGSILERTLSRLAAPEE